jgi:putative ABC transport system permease protein
MAAVLQTLRRAFSRSERATTLAASATLALATAAVLVIACVAHAALLADLPFDDEAAVVQVAERHAARGLPVYAVSVPNFRSFQAEARSFADLAAMRFGDANLGRADEAAAQRVVAWTATHNLWRTLGVPLQLGRAFTAGEERAGGVALLSERLWRQRYGADPGVVGREIVVDGRALRVVGVSPQDLGFVSSVDLWLPMVDDETTQERGDRRLNVVGRLAPGVDLAQANGELAAIAARLAAAHPRGNDGWSAHAIDARSWLVASATRDNLLLVLAGGLLLLLVAAGNIAGLQLARVLARTDEYGVRHALGASRRQLLRHALAGSMVVSVLGLLVGILAGAVTLAFAPHYLPADLPRVDQVALDPLLVAALAGAVLALALGFGLLPALAATRAGFDAAGGGRLRGGLDAAGGHTRRLLVASQFALATAIAVFALALLQQYRTLDARAPGFDAHGVLAARLSLPALQDEAAMQTALVTLDRLVERAQGLPGVRAAAIASELPMGEVNTSLEVAADWPSMNTDGQSVQAAWRLVGPGYFDTLQIPLLRGRAFAADGEAADSIVVSAALALRLWGAADPIGRTLVAGNGRELRVVGVAGDVRHLGRAQEAPYTMYLRTTWLWPTMALLLRADGDLAALAPALRAVAGEVAPAQPLFGLAPLSVSYATDLAAPRGRAWLFGAFALASLLLSAIGITGVMSQWVAQRRRELAMRRALGAGAHRLAGRVLRDALPIAVGGVAAGLAGAALVAGLIDAAVLTPADAGLHALAAAALLAVGLGACLPPMRRAMRADPADVLRES